jgi:hypothetical protein
MTQVCLLAMNIIYLLLHEGFVAPIFLFCLEQLFINSFMTARHSVFLPLHITYNSSNYFNNPTASFSRKKYSSTDICAFFHLFSLFTRLSPCLLRSHCLHSLLFFYFWLLTSTSFTYVTHIAHTLQWSSPLLALSLPTS